MVVAIIDYDESNLNTVLDGTYFGLWSGHCFYLLDNNVVFRVKTKDGVRGINLPHACTVLSGVLTIRDYLANGFDGNEEMIETISDFYGEKEKKDGKVEDSQTEYEKCVASPYYFATTYMTLNGKRFTTRLTEQEFNRSFAELKDNSYSNTLKRR